MNAQRDLNELEQKHGIKSELFNGWTVTSKDGAVYMVKTFQQRTQLIKNLIEAENNNATR